MAHDLHPDYLSTHMNTARIMMKAGRPAEALESLKRASEINPFDPEIWERLAQLAKERGDRPAYDDLMATLAVVKAGK